MKSALELAMEKANALMGDQDIRLTDEQKKAIDQVRKLYEAKWAEQEIDLKGKLQKLARENPQEFAQSRGELQRQMNEVRDRLFAERDARIEEIRRKKG
jgi:hypothetical protein